jgi:hypothetical protein
MSLLRALDAMAEARIEEAMRDGAFDDLPGMGRPLALDDDALVPENVRAAYRVLRNAGFVPPELELRRERVQLLALISALADDEARRRALAKLALLDARLEAMARRSRRDRVYEQKIVAKLGG